MKLFAVLLKNGEEWIMDHAVQETGKFLDLSWTISGFVEGSFKISQRMETVTIY